MHTYIQYSTVQYSTVQYSTYKRFIALVSNTHPLPFQPDAAFRISLDNMHKRPS